jgi:hypothetical protein
LATTVCGSDVAGLSLPDEVIGSSIIVVIGGTISDGKIGFVKDLLCLLLV